MKPIIPQYSELWQFTEMLDRARVKYDYWSVAELLHGVPFYGICLTIGDSDGLYTEYIFDEKGALVSVDVVLETANDKMLIVHNNDNQVSKEILDFNDLDEEEAK